MYQKLHWLRNWIVMNTEVCGCSYPVYIYIAVSKIRRKYPSWNKVRTPSWKHLYKRTLVYRFVMSAPCCEPTNKFLSNGCYLVETRRGKYAGSGTRCMYCKWSSMLRNSRFERSCRKLSARILAKAAMHESILRTLFVRRLNNRISWAYRKLLHPCKAYNTGPAVISLRVQRYLEYLYDIFSSLRENSLSYGTIFRNG